MNTRFFRPAPRGCLTSLTVAVVAAMGIIGAATPVHAEDANPNQTRTVSFAELNMSGQAGAETLYRRIVAAAEGVCNRPDNSNIGATIRFHRCVAGAVSRAVADVNAPTLNRYYASIQGHAPTQLAADSARR